MAIPFQRIHPDAKLPERKHAWDAGLDLFVLEDTVIEPGTVKLVRTGLKVAIPPGYVGLIFERSSFNMKTNLSLSNKVGVIDAGYRGEILHPVRNDLTCAALVKKHDRLAQLLIQEVNLAEPLEVTNLDDTERGEGGYGSTGS